MLEHQTETDFASMFWIPGSAIENSDGICPVIADGETARSNSGEGKLTEDSFETVGGEEPNAER